MYKMQSIVTALQFSDRVRLRVDLTIVLVAPPLCLSLTHHLGIRRPVVSHCVFAYCVGSSASRARLQWAGRFKDLLEVRRCKVSQQRNRLRVGDGLRFY